MGLKTLEERKKEINSILNAFKTATKVDGFELIDREMDTFDNGVPINEDTTYVQYSVDLINYRFLESNQYDLVEIINFGSLIICDYDTFLKVCDEKDVKSKDVIMKVYDLYNKYELYENANAVKKALENIN
jgi:hypothetical protein